MYIYVYVYVVYVELTMPEPELSRFSRVAVPGETCAKLQSRGMRRPRQWRANRKRRKMKGNGENNPCGKRLAGDLAAFIYNNLRRDRVSPGTLRGGPPRDSPPGVKQPEPETNKPTNTETRRKYR